MAYDPRTCPECLAAFVPRRIDQFFHARSCTDARYMREYHSLFYEFALALTAQEFQCYFCGLAADPSKESRLFPLFLEPTDTRPVASCQPCKRAYYVRFRYVQATLVPT